jgi:hypothetical protein
MRRETLLRFLRAMRIFDKQIRIFDKQIIRPADVHVDDNLDGVYYDCRLVSSLPV